MANYTHPLEPVRRRSYVSGRDLPFGSPGLDGSPPPSVRAGGQYSGADRRQTTQAYQSMQGGGALAPVDPRQRAERNLSTAVGAIGSPYATQVGGWNNRTGGDFGSYVRTPAGEKVMKVSAVQDPNTGAWGRKALAPSSRPGKAAAQPKSDLPPNPPRALKPKGPGMINGQPAMAAIAEARKAAEVVPGGGMAPYAANQAGDMARYRQDARERIRREGLDKVAGRNLARPTEALAPKYAPPRNPTGPQTPSIARTMTADQAAARIPAANPVQPQPVAALAPTYPVAALAPTYRSKTGIALPSGSGPIPGGRSPTGLALPTTELRTASTAQKGALAPARPRTPARRGLYADMPTPKTTADVDRNLRAKIASIRSDQTISKDAKARAESEAITQANREQFGVVARATGNAIAYPFRWIGAEIDAAAKRGQIANEEMQRKSMEARRTKSALAPR